MVPEYLTHLRLNIFNKLSHHKLWKSPLYSQRSVIQKSWYLLLLLKRSNVIANSVNTDQMPSYAAFDLGLHCLPMSLLSDARHKWVTIINTQIQLTHIIPKSKGLSEILWDIRTSTSQILQNWGKHKSNNNISQMNMYFDSWKLEIYWKYCGKEEHFSPLFHMFS